MSALVFNIQIQSKPVVLVLRWSL